MLCASPLLSGVKSGVGCSWNRQPLICRRWRPLLSRMPLSHGRRPGSIMRMWEKKIPQFAYFSSVSPEISRNNTIDIIRLKLYCNLQEHFDFVSECVTFALHVCLHQFLSFPLQQKANCVCMCACACVCVCEHAHTWHTCMCARGHASMQLLNETSIFWKHLNELHGFFSLYIQFHLFLNVSACVCMYVWSTDPDRSWAYTYTQFQRIPSKPWKQTSRWTTTVSDMLQTCSRLAVLVQADAY